MADSKITALTSISTSTDPAVDPLVIVDVSDTSMAASGTSKKVTLNNLLSSSPTATGAFSVTGLVTAGSATITGDLTVRTNKLAVTSTGVGIGMTPITPLSGVIGTTGAVFFRTTDPSAPVATPYIQAPVSTGFSSVSPAYGFWYQGCGIGNPALNNVSIITDSTERVKVGSTGDVNISTGNLVMTTSGKGIDFSATGSGSGTMTSELLNDYEEGTWTPVATGLTNVGAVTYIATYTKIGRVVYINLKVTAVTSTTSVANTTFFSGLPFTPALNSTITAVNEGNITSLGVGLIATGSTVFTPNWTAVQNATISGFYYV